MAIYCIDYINGSDVTGTGSAAAPWKTIGYGETQVTEVAGDEFRIHAGPAPTLLDTAAYQTSANSFIIQTSVNLTGSLVANDYIFIQDFNRAFRIQTITSTQIVLYSTLTAYPNYLGNAVTFSIWKVGGVPVPVTAIGSFYDDIAKTASPFAINSDSIIVSGGWNDTFDAKTAFGRTFFYRTGAFFVNNSVAGCLYRATDCNGWVFKDLHISGSGLVNLIINTVVTGGNAKFDNLVVTSIGATSIVATRSATDDCYLTNSTIVHSTLTSSTQLNMAGNTGQYPGVMRLNGLTQIFMGKGDRTTWTSFRYNTTNQTTNIKIELGNTTYINQYDNTIWGVLDQYVPCLYMFSNIGGGVNYTNYIRIDNLTIQGFPIQLYNSWTSSTSSVKSYVELDATALSKLKFVGVVSNGMGPITIKAPGSPFNTAGGAVCSSNQDNALLSMSLQPIKWIDTVNNKDWYISGTAVSYLDTVNYVTGTNSLAVRPVAVGDVNIVYGAYVPAGIAVYKKESEVATITVKMKLLGPSAYVANIQLIFGATLNTRVGFPSYQALVGTFISGSAVATTAEWTDVVYTVPADTQLQSDSTLGYYFFIGEGISGSSLAEAGKWLLIDSVTITVA